MTARYLMPLRERQGVSVAELAGIKSALSHALTSVPRQPKGAVGVDSVVEAKLIGGQRGEVRVCCRRLDDAHWQSG